MQKWFPEFFDKYGAFTVFDLLVDYLKSGRIKIDKTMITQRAAYHDPCNYCRKSEEMFGHGYYEEPRWILGQCVSDWVDLFPSKANQYCCGGGGGTLLTPFKEERIHYGRKKIEQIRRCGAEMIILPCHSCHGQIKALLAENEIDHIPVKYLWEVVADALVIK
ncbi:MAG: (Fe-S)-binding protein [Desulfobacteraceae bacterium]|nr:MAG: (Fe-S)-binding protein [Desulfobacteraceae bacterium]